MAMPAMDEALRKGLVDPAYRAEQAAPVAEGGPQVTRRPGGGGGFATSLEGERAMIKATAERAGIRLE